MQQKIDPKSIGLNSNTEIFQDGRDNIILFINRKSRIIMKDAANILNKINTIKSAFKDKKVYVKTSAPVCSKTRAFLNEKGIEIKSVD